MAELLMGRPVADNLVEMLKKRTDILESKGIKPRLAIVRAGENASDLSYERGAMKKAEACGIEIRNVVFEENVSEEVFLNSIKELNEDIDIHGILIFRPLPKQIDDEKVRNTLLPKKDMDCITDGAMAGVFMNEEKGYPPCTAEAVIELLDYYGIDPKGKKVTVLGRSLVIGRPVAMLLMHRNATITICHTKTSHEDEVEKCRDADIIVSAVGRRNVVKTHMVREGQTVIDVGINFDDIGKLCGDVSFEEVEQIVERITPVPGGIGAITSALLMKHVVMAAEKECNG